MEWENARSSPFSIYLFLRRSISYNFICSLLTHKLPLFNMSIHLNYEDELQHYCWVS